MTDDHPSLRVFDESMCQLGEGPIWHPGRQAFFWFDILDKKLYMRAMDATSPTCWRFDDYVTAGHWIDHDHLLIATERELSRFNIVQGTRQPIALLEADNPTTRPNDGRADAHGGFWISTMALDARKEASTIYRYYLGELRQVHSNLTIANGICFSPDGTTAYFADSAQQQLWELPLNADGWPVAAAKPLIDFSKHNSTPDGATTDAEGHLWIAEWGSSRVSCYSPSGERLRVLLVPARQPTCPVFGGLDLNRLLITTAGVGLNDADLEEQAIQGETLIADAQATGWDTGPVKVPA